MKYIAIDIETLGLDPSLHSVIEVGALIEDTEKKLSYEDIPKYNVLLKHDAYIAQTFPMVMHHELLKEYDSKTPSMKIIYFDLFSKDFAYWLSSNGINISKPINIAGKNVASFDLPFLRNLPEFTETFKIKQRILDPAILYFEPSIDKYGLPNLEDCKKRAGLHATVAHTALADAWDVVELIRNKF